jgi:G3E family GTPase
MPLYTFLHNLLNELVEIADIIRLQKQKQNSFSARGVYVLEAAEHNAQTAIAVADMQQQQQQQQQLHQVQQVPAHHFHPQAQPQQQLHQHHHHHQQAQSQTYYNSVPISAQAQGNTLALVDGAVHMSQAQNMQVTGNHPDRVL